MSSLQQDMHVEKVGKLKRTIEQQQSEIFRLQQELHETKERLKEKTNLFKTEFIRNMEHDIRTPFNGVWGIANYLWENESDPHKKEFLGDVTNCAKELMEYCNDILDFSKIEQGSLAILTRKFNLRQLIDGILLIELPPAKYKKLELNLNYEDGLPPILIGDEYRLKRILINLLSNAIKFTQQGFVKLHVKLLKQVDANKVIINFIVEDTGIGIPQEKHDLIYEKFVKVIPSNKGTHKGIGLGLGIVKQFVEEMSGNIDLKSTLGSGSIFTCTLPFAF